MSFAKCFYIFFHMYNLASPLIQASSRQNLLPQKDVCLSNLLVMYLKFVPFRLRVAEGFPYIQVNLIDRVPW